MKKKELIEIMKSGSRSSSFITRQEFADIFHIRPKTADRYLQGLPRIHGKHYLITDVAAHLMKDTTIK